MYIYAHPFFVYKPETIIPDTNPPGPCRSAPSMAARPRLQSEPVRNVQSGTCFARMVSVAASNGLATGLALRERLGKRGPTILQSTLPYFFGEMVGEGVGMLGGHAEPRRIMEECRAGNWEYDVIGIWPIICQLQKLIATTIAHQHLQVVVTCL